MRTERRGGEEGRGEGERQEGRGGGRGGEGREGRGEGERQEGRGGGRGGTFEIVGRRVMKERKSYSTSIKCVFTHLLHVLRSPTPAGTQPPYTLQTILLK